MKKIIIPLLLLFLAIAVNAQSNSSKLLVGASRVSIDVTPDMYPMPTHFGVSDALYDSCYCRAITIQCGESKALLLIYELSDYPTIENIEEKIAAATGFPRKDIFLTVTHNHTSPCDEPNAWMRDSPEMSKKREIYKEIELQAGIKAVNEAIRTMRPARYGFGTIDSYVNVNRDYKTRYGYWVENSNFEGYSDKTLSAIKFVDLDGNLIAALLNHGTHSTNAFLEKDFDHKIKTSGNFSGIACKFAEKYYGKNAVVAWTAGAAGDQDPIISHGLLYEYPDGYVTEVAFPDGVGYMLMESIGRTHGADAVKCIDSIKLFSENASIQHIETKIDLPTQKRIRTPDGKMPNVRMGDKGLRDWEKIPYGEVPPIPDFDHIVESDPVNPVNMSMHLLTIGNIALVLTNGEMYAKIGDDIKKVSPLKNTVVITYSMAPNTNYIIDKNSIEHKVFQAFGNVVPGESDDLIIDAAKSLFEYIPK